MTSADRKPLACIPSAHPSACLALATDQEDAAAEQFRAGLDAVTVASIAVTVLATSLPQPDYVSVSPGLTRRELPVQREQPGRRAVGARPRVGPVLRHHPGPSPRRQGLLLLPGQVHVLRYQIPRARARRRGRANRTVDMREYFTGPC
jgi:hypothetical protein